jgi:hypothetical protein
MQGLSLARNQGEQITLTCGGETVVIHFDDCKHRACRVRVVAPPGVKIWRGPPPLEESGPALLPLRPRVYRP